MCELTRRCTVLLWLVPPLPFCCLTSPLSHSASTLLATKASEDPLSHSLGRFFFLGDRPVELGAWWAAQQVQKSERATGTSAAAAEVVTSPKAQCPNFFSTYRPPPEFSKRQRPLLSQLPFIPLLSTSPLSTPKTFIPSAPSHSFHIRQNGRAHSWKACSRRRGSVSHFFTFRYHLDPSFKCIARRFTIHDANYPTFDQYASKHSRNRRSYLFSRSAAWCC